MSKPSSLAFSPDFSRLYVSNSGVGNAFVKEFRVKYSDKKDSIELDEGKIFFSLKEQYQDANIFTIRVDDEDRIYLGTSLGLLVLSKDAVVLGKIAFDNNVVPKSMFFADDGWLYILSDSVLLRAKVKSKAMRNYKRLYGQ